MKRRMFLLAVVCVVSVLGVSARPIEIKLGSVAPDNSIYSEILLDLAAEWEEISDGRVKLKIYFSGFKDDSDLIRKIRINQLQAGVVTGFGLQVLYPNVFALSIPSLIQTDEELDYVLEKIQPTIQKKLERKGFELLAWSTAGWLYFFTREPVIYPEDLEKQKIASSGSGAAAGIVNAFKQVGFQPVNVPSNEQLPAFYSGKADAIYATPIAMAAGQFFAVIDNMTDIKTAPFVGGFIFSRRAWRRIPADIRPKLRDSIDRVAERLNRELSELEEEALEEMKKRGLQVHTVPEEAKRLWNRKFDTVVEWASGNLFDEVFVQQIEGYLEEFHRTRQ